jgi:hypothetical protein
MRGEKGLRRLTATLAISPPPAGHKLPDAGGSGRRAQEACQGPPEGIEGHAPPPGVTTPWRGLATTTGKAAVMTVISLTIQLGLVASRPVRHQQRERSVTRIWHSNRANEQRGKSTGGQRYSEERDSDNIGVERAQAQRGSMLLLQSLKAAHGPSGRPDISPRAGRGRR